jgi:hypothetical protein
MKNKQTPTKPLRAIVPKTLPTGCVTIHYHASHRRRIAWRRSTLRHDVAIMPHSAKDGIQQLHSAGDGLSSHR